MNQNSCITKEHCNQCHGTKNHSILFAHENKWREGVSSNPADDIWGKDRYEVLECAGCNHIVFRHTATNSEDYDDNSSLIKTINYYPPRHNRIKPKLFSAVAGGIQFINKSIFSDLLNEIYIALYSESHRLAAMGIRALLEHIFIDKVGDQGSFATKLTKFESEGIICTKERELLEATLEVGHAAIHRNYKPEIDVLNSCLDITEDLIMRLYLYPQQIKAIKKGIPIRENSQ